MAWSGVTLNEGEADGVRGGREGVWGWVGGEAGAGEAVANKKEMIIIL
jgi:hypothetical protein